MPCIKVNILFFYVLFIHADLLTYALPQPTQETDTLTTESGVLSITTETNSVGTTCIDDECNPRLLSNIEVHCYELEYIYSNVSDTTVQGYVSIDFTLKQPIKQLIYHAKRILQLEEPALYEDGVYRHVTMRTYPPNDYVSLRLLSTNTSFATNRYTLKQKFVVSLTDGNVGFYQSLYHDGNGTIGYKNIE